MGMGATDPPAPPRSINLSSCVPSTSPSPSPSWPAPSSGRRRGGGGTVAAVQRLQLAARDAVPGVTQGWWCGHRAWRKLLRRLAQETRCICSSPAAASRQPITFGYDAASYAKNFDDGLRRPALCPPYAVVVANAAADKSAGL
ncbi:uncharacterized protein LOC100824677 [Brachypodium distachyon]|uniref:uncharacterized protein LOC100824677 n=1 Tax=Brachypodium distachyon TaxID=15368 RepID=UPI000234E18D|nr:uncharacterized protein LOC100824677 [Brachypodium distachyon]|eukprot:XP_003567120.1 uncharacterized protein LOC100824677 [Brachypodium distachyon]